MSLSKATAVRAGDTEPLRLVAGLKANAELVVGDVTAAVLYARLVGATTNHVDGEEVTVESLTATDNGDGTWDVEIILEFDPVGKGPDSGDAFPVGSEGTYKCVVEFTWSDDDITQHPAADDDLTLDLVVTASLKTGS